MGTELLLSAVDYHTAGEPFRVVSEGIPKLRGSSILEKRRYAQDHLDHIRELLVYEPRGHADMYGGFVTEPDEGADVGVVFFHNAGYSTACGHGTIALVTWAIEMGVVAVTGPETEVVVDVPSGRLTTFARVEDGRVESVRFRNVPSFVSATGLKVKTELGTLEADVSYGGAFYASVHAGDLGLSVEPGELNRFIELGREIKRAIEAQHEFVHPLEPQLRGIYGVIFFDRLPSEGMLTQRNVTIFADGEVDRSPCGSGTSARLAILDATGELPRGENLLHRSIIGTEFNASVVDESKVADHPAVITEVEGSAWLTGFHTFVLEQEDPLGSGFLLR